MISFKNINKCFIVAEISSNHHQDISCAISMIRHAKRCGADAVKFQAFSPGSITFNSNNRYFRVKHPRWGGQTLYELYKKAYTPWGWFKELKKIADSEGIIFFASAFSKEAVDFLEDLNVPIHKISSFELVDLPLIEYAAGTKKPLVLSTGMATTGEIKEAVDAAKAAQAKEIILLKCTSSYPARHEDINLRTVADMRQRFCCPIGFSDHSLGTAASVAAVSLGAAMIEKHFILSKRINTPDNFFSADPKEFKELVNNIRIAEKSLGRVYYGLTEDEKNSRIFRRSLFSVEDIKKGDLLTDRNIKSIRPGHGLKPKYIKAIIGKRARKDIERGTPIKPGLFR